jgi:YegS/Rv2252/BmrU family lipid kinase
MKIRFIINPISGIGKQKGIEDVIKRYLVFSYDIVYTKKCGDATILSKKAIKDKKDIVIAVGGDGTVSECSKALIGSNVAIGVIPCGSGNGFAYHIGMKRDIKKAILQLNISTLKTIDSCTANDERFVNVSGIGFDSHIANLFANNKKRGLFNYLKLIIKELSYQPEYYKIEYNNTKKEVKAYLIAFANTSQYGNDFEISPFAKLDDGLIDFVIVKVFSKWKIPFFLLKVAKGKVHLSKNVEIIKSKEMSIESKNRLVHLDGEPKELKSPIVVKVKPRTLKIFSPNGKK